MVNQNPLEALYSDECDIFTYAPVKDPVSKITKHQLTSSIESVPCRLSYQRISPANQNAAAASIEVVAKLFLSPNVTVKAGSKIVVTRNGKIHEFKSSGEPSIYSAHQEIMLELFKGWA